MKTLGFALVLSAALAAVALPVWAQTSPSRPTPSHEADPAEIRGTVTGKDSIGGGQLAGANITEDEARGRLEAEGYRSISGLRKDDQSVWRGQAEKDGRAVDVAIDGNGDVIDQ